LVAKKGQGWKGTQSTKKKWFNGNGKASEGEKNKEKKEGTSQNNREDGKNDRAGRIDSLTNHNGLACARGQSPIWPGGPRRKPRATTTNGRKEK